MQEDGWKAALHILLEGGSRKRLLKLPAEQAKAHAERRESMTATARA